MKTNNVNFLVSLNALHADEIDKPETSINPIIVKKEPGTGSLFSICTFETFVLHTQIRNNNFDIKIQTLTQIRNKEPVPGSRFRNSRLSVL